MSRDDARPVARRDTTRLHHDDRRHGTYKIVGPAGTWTTDYTLDGWLT
jgi:hypothetical protein